MQKKVTSGERIVIISPRNEENEYMVHHIIDGKNLIPAVAYLDIVWETLALLQGETHTDLSIVFEDVSFMRATHLPKEGEVRLIVMVQKGMPGDSHEVIFAHDIILLKYGIDNYILRIRLYGFLLYLDI